MSADQKISRQSQSNKQAMFPVNDALPDTQGIQECSH
jgi:hypothetical protein